MRELSRIKDSDPALKASGVVYRDPLRLWAKVHRGKKEGTGDTLAGAPGSHKKRRDREISNHRVRLV